MNETGRHPIEEEVLRVIRPTSQQLKILSRIYKLISVKLDRCLSERGLEYTITPVGSYAKGTITSYKWELDVFILFRNVDDKWIMEKSETLLKDCLSRHFPVIIKYAQHPYVTIEIMGIEADIVPALWVEKPRKKGLGVERTPFHTQYVVSRLNDYLRDEVRLFKSFLKGIGVYGAETGVRGFSGYLAEILIIAYNGFRNLLQEASHWKPPVYIDPEGVGDKGKLQNKYKDSVIIVVDPVDPERNTAASVSLKSLATLIHASRLYLSKPRKEFFYPFMKPSRIIHPTPVIVIRCEGSYETLSPEAILGKGLRAARNLYSELVRSGFKPTTYLFDTNEYNTIILEIGLEEEILPEYEVSAGPYAWDKIDNTLKFILKRMIKGEGYWIGDDGRLYALRSRKTIHARDLVNKWLSEKGYNILKTRNCKVTIERCPGEARLCQPVPEWMTS